MMVSVIEVCPQIFLRFDFWGQKNFLVTTWCCLTACGQGPTILRTAEQILNIYFLGVWKLFWGWCFHGYNGQLHDKRCFYCKFWVLKMQPNHLLLFMYIYDTLQYSWLLIGHLIGNELLFFSKFKFSSYPQLRHPFSDNCRSDCIHDRQVMCWHGNSRASVISLNILRQ